MVLVGYFKEIHELADRLNIELSAIVDPTYDIENEFSIEIYPSDKCFLSCNENKNVFITPDSPKTRNKIFDLYYNAGHKLKTLICPTAIISPTAKLGYSCCVQSGVNISSNVLVGTGVKINSFANVMHDSIIGDFSTIAPSAVLLGGVTIGKCSYIGANATVLPGINVGSEVIVGAGSVVTKDIPNGSVVCGNPARKIR